MGAVSAPALPVGLVVTVIRGTYSAIPVGTVAPVVRVRPRRGKDTPELYEISGFPEYLFWSQELTWEGKGGR